MVAGDARWVLAFDGSCGACGGIADAVAAAAGSRIDVLPLQNPDVAAWRRHALGEDAAWKPVLLQVAADGSAQGWTGIRLAGRLVGRLGPGGSLRVVRTIGRLRAMNARGEVRRPGDTTPLKRLSRKRLVRDVGLGAVTVMQIVVTGAAPAAADTVGGWERTVEGSLPTTLPELAALPVAYRRAAYPSMTPEQQSTAWVDHLDSSGARPADEGQRAAFDQAREYAGNPSHFRDPDLAALEAIAAKVTAAFGAERATAMLAVLGPPDEPPTDLAAPTCSCSTASDYCSGAPVCRLNRQNCVRTTGCGTFYSYACDGLCA